jgi:hypothetical protein
MKMEAVLSFETFVNFYGITWRQRSLSGRKGTTLLEGSPASPVRLYESEDIRKSGLTEGPREFDFAELIIKCIILKDLSGWLPRKQVVSTCDLVAISVFHRSQLK